MDEKEAQRIIIGYQSERKIEKINGLETPWLGVEYQLLLDDVRRYEASQERVHTDGVHIIYHLSNFRQHAAKLASAFNYLENLVEYTRKVRAKEAERTLKNYSKEFRWWFYFYSGMDACGDGFFAHGRP